MPALLLHFLLKVVVIRIYLTSFFLIYLIKEPLYHYPRHSVEIRRYVVEYSKVKVRSRY